jgi:hypothetical protein
MALSGFGLSAKAGGFNGLKHCDLGDVPDASLPGDAPLVLSTSPVANPLVAPEQLALSRCRLKLALCESSSGTEAQEIFYALMEIGRPTNILLVISLTRINRNYGAKRVGRRTWNGFTFLTNPAPR